MPYVSHHELNQYIKNFRLEIGLPEREMNHAAYVQDYFINNLSNAGRYIHRDFERFGSLNTITGSADHMDRQDGWVAVTHEVPHIDHLTYGTGIFYIHGEMEIPIYEDAPGDNIRGDEFHQTDKGGVPHFFDPALPYLRWMEVPPGDWGPMGQQLCPPKYQAGYVWEWEPGVTDTDMFYEFIMENVGGHFMLPNLNQTAVPTYTVPDRFNDAEIYTVESERNNYPWVVIQSSQPASLKTFLENWEGDVGMYDDKLPQIAIDVGTYPPVVFGGITYVGGGIRGILDYISPINETP